MEPQNHSSVSEFILLGLTDNFKLRILLFVIFSLVYVFTVLGNALFFVLIWTDPHLQTPMYFFLSNLSCVDLLLSTSVTPKLLSVLLSYRIISFLGCAVQFMCFAFLCLGECHLLAVMAYDRYVAICKPLLYPLIMSQRTCCHLICATYVWSFLNGALQTSLAFNLSFCRLNEIDHFFCDLPPLLKLSCSDTSTNEVVVLLSTSLVFLVTCGIIMPSYCFIVWTILRIRSVEGRHKAYSTCTSHLTVVSIFFGTLFIIYLQPVSGSQIQNKVLSLFYTVVIPMLNPVIYSFRNQEVKKELLKMFKKVDTWRQSKVGSMDRKQMRSVIQRVIT